MGILPEEDKTILGLCSHGFTKELDESSFRPEFLQSDISRDLVSACISLQRDGKNITAPAVIAKARVSVPGLVPEVIAIFKNGYGSAQVNDAVEHSYQVYVAKKAREIGQELQRLATSDPANSRQWLIQQAGQIAAIVRDGDTYDPRPSSLASGQMPGIFATSLITDMNNILRGGYRTAYLMIYAGITKHGKSTTLQSHVIDLALQKFHVAVVSTENDPAIIANQLGAALSGINFMSEVVAGKFKDTERESAEERQTRFKRNLEYLSEYVRIYPSSYCNDEALKRIVRWQKTDAVILDYLKKIPNLFSKRTNSMDEVGDFADFLLEFSHKEGLWFGTAGQISNEMATKLLRKDSGDPVILYGTARVGQAADEFAFLKRHPDIANRAYFRVQLDRYYGQLDTRHENTPVDKLRNILEIKRLTSQDEPI